MIRAVPSADVGRVRLGTDVQKLDLLIDFRDVVTVIDLIPLLPAAKASIDGLAINSGIPVNADLRNTLTIDDPVRR